GLAAGGDAEDRLPAGEIRRGHEQLAVEAAGAEEGGIEILDPVRGAHDDHLPRVLEAVELDEQLVQGLILLAVEAVAGALRADGVELVDEDDRGRVLPRLVGALADARGAESGEHLDERRRGGAVEVRPRLVRDGLGEQRLAGTRRAVEEETFRDPGAESLEALGVAHALDARD